MLRRAMDLDALYQVIFICHTPLVSELADRGGGSQGRTGSDSD